jgi:hypothetical protein
MASFQSRTSSARMSSVDSKLTDRDVRILRALHSLPEEEQLLLERLILSACTPFPFPSAPSAPAAPDPL